MTWFFFHLNKKRNVYIISMTYCQNDRQRVCSCGLCGPLYSITSFVDRIRYQYNQQSNQLLLKVQSKVDRYFMTCLTYLKNRSLLVLQPWMMIPIAQSPNHSVVHQEVELINHALIARLISSSKKHVVGRLVFVFFCFFLNTDVMKVFWR